MEALDIRNAQKGCVHRYAMIQPETAFERELLTDPAVQQGLQWGSPRRGHEEGRVIVHVERILQFIDAQDWRDYREELRVLAILHDSFKYLERGRPIKAFPGPGNHAWLAAEYYASLRPDDRRVQDVLLHHDTPWRFFKQARSGRFSEQLFIDAFNEMDVELLARFVYADTDGRSEVGAWFEQAVRKLLPEKLQEITRV